MTTLSDSLKHDGFILSSLVTRDFKLKYRRSVLGIAWSVLNPLLMMIVLSAVFGFLFSRFDLENFPLYLILGQVLFNYMAASTSSGMTSIVDASSLIKKIRVNKMLFPLEKVVFELINLLISFIAVVIVMLFFQIPPTLNILFLPLLLLYVFFFCAGLSLLLSALTVFFRDVVHLWSVIITAWTYATPLFYPMDILPEFMQGAMAFNPMYHFVTYFREIALWGTTPGLSENILCAAMAIATFALGLLVFKRMQKKFILYV